LFWFVGFLIPFFRACLLNYLVSYLFTNLLAAYLLYLLYYCLIGSAFLSVGGVGGAEDA
jgi:hypothetical protein